MQQGDACICPRAEIIADLARDDLLALKEGERLWKLYCFREEGHTTGLRHRIYTKQKADGRLALVTFAAHNPLAEPNEEHDGAQAQEATVRSGIARVADLSVADLERLIAAMRRQTNSHVCEELDLSNYATLEEQLSRLHSESRA